MCHITPAHILKLFLLTRSCLYSREESSILSTSTPLCRSNHSCDAAERARSNTTRRGHRRGYVVVSVRLCMCALVPLFPNMHIFAFDMTMGQFYLHAQLQFPLLYFSRISWIFQDATVSRPQLQRIINACEAIVRNITQRALCCQSRRTGFL